MDIREVHMPTDGAKRVLCADETEQENDEYQTTKCADEPLPTMYEAMNGLIPWTLKRCELAKGFADKMSIRTVKFIPRQEGTSIVVTLVKELKGGDRLVWTAPQKAIEDDSVTMGICKRIRTEAEKWRNRERLQGDLLDEQAQANG